MNKSLLELDRLLSDFEDLESLAYGQIKHHLKNGITYKTNNFKYSANASNSIPMNFIKPFFNLFHEDSILYFKSKFKKRKVMENFRGNIETVPLCLDDVVELEVFQNNKLIFTKKDKLLNFEKATSITFENINPTFKIRLIEDGLSRKKMEEELNTYYYINSLIEKYVFSLRNKIIPSRKKQSILRWFEEKLNIKDFEVSKMTVNDLKKISLNVFEIEQLLNTLILSETIVLTKTKRQEEYINQLEYLMKHNYFEFSNQIIIFGR